MPTACQFPFDVINDGNWQQSNKSKDLPQFIAKEFTSAAINTWYNSMQHIKSLEKSKKWESKNFSKQDLQKYENKDIP